MPGNNRFDMSDYVPVNERIDAFYRAHPEGSLQSEIVELTAARVTVKACAYRTPDDPRPGVGHSSLDIPGSTPYTRGSEIENAETSAWGRAIAALGFEVKRGVASAEEVRNKAHPPSNGHRPAAAPSKRDELLALAHEYRLGGADLERYAEQVGVPAGERASEAQYGQIIELIRGADPVPFEHAQPTLTRETLRGESSSAGQSTGRQEVAGTPSPPGSPPAEPTPDDLQLVLAASGGTLEQPESAAPPGGADPVLAGEAAASAPSPSPVSPARAEARAVRERLRSR